MICFPFSRRLGGRNKILKGRTGWVNVPMRRYWPCPTLYTGQLIWSERDLLGCRLAEGPSSLAPPPEAVINVAEDEEDCLDGEGTMSGLSCWCCCCLACSTNKSCILPDDGGSNEELGLLKNKKKRRNKKKKLKPFKNGDNKRLVSSRSRHATWCSPFGLVWSMFTLDWRVSTTTRT